MPPKKAAKAPRCPVDGCKYELVGANKNLCQKCSKHFCAEHSYPPDHECKGNEKAKAKGDEGGLVVMGKKKEEEAKELKKKENENDEKILSGLLAAKPEDLLKDLMTFGASSSRYENSVIVQAMSSESKQVSKALMGPIMTSVLSVATSSNDTASLISLLEKQILDMGKKNMSPSEERRLACVASICGMVVQSTSRDEIAAVADRLFDPLVEVCGTVSDKVSKPISSDLIRPLVAGKWPSGSNYESEVQSKLLDLCERALSAKEDDDNLRNGFAFAIGGIAQGTGSIFCAEDIVTSLEPALKNPKDTGRIMGCMRIVLQCCKDFGEVFAPYLINGGWLEITLNKVYDKVAAGARSTVKKAMVQYAEKFGPRGVRLSVPLLLSILEEGAWRPKALALQLLGVIAKKKEPQMFRDLPIIVPSVMECVKDTKKQVSETAAETLDFVGGMIANAETLQLMPWLLDALKNPDKVESCLDELMDTTFVNSVDAQSLAMIIPVVLRALRDGNADVKLKGSITTGNVCSLVADVHDMRPFVPALMPELKKLQEHSNPRVRENALKAKQSLQEDMNLARRRSSHDQQNNCMVDLNATKFLNEEIEKVPVMQGIRSRLIHEFVMETARMILFDLFEDIDENYPRTLALKLANDLVGDGIWPIVKEASVEEGAKSHFVSSVAQIVIASLWMARGKSVSVDDGAGSDEKDYIVYLPSIILGFASKLLLKRTGLYLERGRRYAVVGMNGVGKTTLLNRIAARDIDGFPDDLSVYYVQHEILAEDKDLTVVQYMQRDLEESVLKKKSKKSTPEDRLPKIKQSLADVGFSEQLQNSAVASLSGGWRMRLAIARSMLYNARLLLLDEPTNHLDVDAVRWLQNYLVSLTDTTIGLVSHDYDFVNFVSTDIIHLADLKLTYYPCTFKEFQVQRPDIVAALPKKDDSGSSGPTALELLAKAENDDGAASLVANIKPINFPEGCKLNGVANRGRPIVTLADVGFAYPGTDRTIFSGVSVKLSLNSRVALLGPNGAGKSTLLKLLVGELELKDGEVGNEGKLWKHQSVRISYIAQHSMHHLESSIEQTPCQYIQARFWEGQDREASKMITVRLTPDDEEAMTRSGEISEIVSRVIRGKKLYYEVLKNGRMEKGDNKDFRSLEELEAMGKSKPHVMKLVRLFDEKLKMSESGTDLRPLTTPEMIKHLEQFGIESELAQRKIRWMSGGQKSRLVLAAAMWTRPHIVVLDEPTNYLDNESMAALTHALKNFRGGVLLISHHEGFVSAIAKELWHMGNGTLRVELLKKANEE